jgi:hypothetical protein
MKYFITFGDRKYYNSINRIVNEAKTFQLFDYVKGFNDKDLKDDKEFWIKHGELIEKNDTHGYGFWIWKPYLVLKTLSIMKDGDIMLYADAGCHLNIKGINRMKEYISIVERSKYGIISFQMIHCEERKYTKTDVLEYLKIESDIRESGQLVGGVFVLKKCEHVEKIVNLWYQTCCQYNLVNDSLGTLPNDKEFIATRCDQSIWSVIRKKYGTELVPDETYRNPTWNEQYPIWAMRIKQ